jgi:hypothetical protein
VAEEWLRNVPTDGDLTADTRVSVPAAYDRAGRTFVWATLGVRLAKLDAQYAIEPHLKPADSGEWRPASSYGTELETAKYLIPVDEFAELKLPGKQVLSRQELRAACDREKTKEAIVAALEGRSYSPNSPANWSWRVVALGMSIAAAAVLLVVAVVLLARRRLRSG